jgi:hypothetical protein
MIDFKVDLGNGLISLIQIKISHLEELYLIAKNPQGNPKITLNSYAENLPELLAKTSLVIGG